MNAVKRRNNKIVNAFLSAFVLTLHFRGKFNYLRVPGHPEADEPLVEAGGLGPAHVEGLVLEQVVLNFVPDLANLLTLIL